MSSPTLRELAADVLRRRGMPFVDAAKALARAVLASPAVESAPAASGWRKEPPTVADLMQGPKAWWHCPEGRQRPALYLMVIADGEVWWEQDPRNKHAPVPVSQWPDGVWAPCLPPSAPAADAGIVARLREALADEVAYADRLAAELARRPHALNCAHRVHLQRCDCYVGREEAEHAARRGG